MALADEPVKTALTGTGLSRRAFLKYCASMASLFALPGNLAAELVSRLQTAHRLPVIWLSCQECTGCTESLTRSTAPSVENLLFDFISLDYHHTLMAAAGAAAESARKQTLKDAHGRFLLVVDGSIPTRPGYSTIAGIDNLTTLRECLQGAAAVIALGSCATFGGLPAAQPNPTGALGVSSLMQRGLVPARPLVNLPGCPPIPVVISGLLAHYLAFGRFPQLDEQYRPLAFYANTVHQRCSRYHFYQQKKFAERFDDEGARKGWCLYKLGCRGPDTHNACATLKWNNATSSPIDAGHPCIGCSEPGFWDRGGFYQRPDAVTANIPAAKHSYSVDSGRAFYRDSCTTCHSADPGALRTPADSVADLLRSGQVPSHRGLDFSEEQLQQLQTWLQSLARNTGQQ